MSAVALATSVVGAVSHFLGPVLLAGVVTMLVAFVFRAKGRIQLPDGAALILGLGVAGIYLNTRDVFVQYLRGGGISLTAEAAMVNMFVFVLAGMATYGGRRLGDRMAASERITWGALQPDLGPVVRGSGRFITVTLPADIGDIDGYDPVPEETKESLTNQTFDFPRGLTVAELETQVGERLKERDYVGYVDIDLTDEGDVAFLALGQRAAGLGPTLPPNSAAVALRADPPFSATPGDTVQIWRRDEGGGSRRLGVAELRASVGEVATVATDVPVADEIDPRAEHRFMTLSADAHPDREFAAMLRGQDETMSVVDVAAESPLVGRPIGDLDVAPIAVRSSEGDVDTIPQQEYVIQAGDRLFAIGRPQDLRTLEALGGTEITAFDETEVARGDAA
ncbi:MAG: TrkA C-terminal domain-containing protein [Haloferacaceae archaeon]